MKIKNNFVLVTLKPKSRVSSEVNSKDLAFEDEVVLEIRRLLNKENIHRSSASRTEGYIHSVQRNNDEPVLYFNPQSKKGLKGKIIKKIFEVLNKEKKYKIDYTEGGNGLKVFLRPSIVAMKLQHVSYNPLMDDDVLLQSVLNKPLSFHYALLSKLGGKVLAGFIEKSIS